MNQKKRKLKVQTLIFFMWKVFCSILKKRKTEPSSGHYYVVFHVHQSYMYYYVGFIAK